MVLIYKPDFVKHSDGAPIFSVDCHPDGSRMATAGGDQKVKVWNLSAVKSRDVEGDPNVPKILATLSDHFNTVNCVRFSRNGRFLASGSTDTQVFLYEKRSGPGRAAFGSSDEPNVENWVNVKNLKGHVSDVIDIAWAPDDSMLASCSLDNLVIVWDPVTGQRVKTLKGHNSFVKGVAWDPIGKFLASQADDKCCIIWRVDDWSIVSKVTEPYQSSMGATFSLRLCWSPDGKAVTTCNSYKKPSHTASVLERGDWGSKFDFVGHKGPVVTVRFSPSLFKPGGEDAAAGKKKPPHTVIACGSQDCKMTVWATNRPKPVCIVKTMFTQSVVDTCWSPDGYSLIACSTDGTVAVFTFDEAELGVAMSDADTRAFLNKEYGDLRKRGPILEDPSLLQYEQAATPTKALPPATKAPVPAPATNGAASGKAPKRIAPTALGGPATNSNLAPSPSAPVPAPAGPPTSEIQLETRGSDGRRRIMPVPQGGGAAPAPAGGARRITPATTNGALSGMGSPPAMGGSSALKRRLEPTAMGGVNGFDNPNKRMMTSHEHSRGAGDSRGGGGYGPPVMMLAPGGHAGAASLPTRAIPITLHCQLESGRDARDPFAAAAADGATVGEDSLGAADAPVMLEAKNGERHCDLICSAAGVVRWTDRCAESRATHLVGSSKFAAAFFENGTVQLYTPAGRRAMPPLVLPGKAAFVSAAAGRLVAVFSECTLLVWELGVPGEEREVARESVAPLLTGPRAPPAPPMIGVRLAKCGSPIAQFADGHSYVFHGKLKSWARVADHSFPRSEFTTRLRMPGAAGGELHALQMAAARASIGMGPSALLSGGAPAPRRETGRHLECLMASADILGSSAEYRSWLKAYVRHLAAEGAEDQAVGPLRELCVSMLGPLSGEPDGPGDDDAPGGDGAWVASVAGGLKKRDLLREVVFPALAQNRGSQRLLGEYAELLTEADKR